MPKELMQLKSTWPGTRTRFLGRYGGHSQTRTLVDRALGAASDIAQGQTLKARSSTSCRARFPLGFPSGEYAFGQARSHIDQNSYIPCIPYDRRPFRYEITLIHIVFQGRMGYSCSHILYVQSDCLTILVALLTHCGYGVPSQSLKQNSMEVRHLLLISKNWRPI